jgi:DNA-binding HxlR family transcriptional regulator
MPRATVDPSAIGQAVLAIADQWTLLILQRAFLLGTRRFADWRDQLGMSESVLAARLKELVEQGLLQPRPYRDVRRTRTEYLLTVKALETWSILVAIWSWERNWVAHREPLPELLHKTCGHRAEIDLACRACHRSPVSARDTETTRGPAATFAHVAVARLHRRTVRPGGADDPLSYYSQTFEILGDRWSTVVLAAAFLGVSRFAGFEAELGVAPSVLSARLRRFTELGILAMRPASDGRREYKLDDKGMAFFGVFALLTDWAQRWYVGPPGTELHIVHRECCQPFHPVLRCRSCGEQLTRTSIDFPSVRDQD